jgi:hypothetical protein
MKGVGVGLLCLVIQFSFAQAPEDQIQQLKGVIPPSPNAAALAKFGDWPVNLYTGVPSISIPLYTLASRDITVPVTLDYHASGIRVSEIASWVGLGWALNAGGVISRTVRGVPDEEPAAGYFKYRTLYSDPANLNSTAPEIVWKLHRVEASQGSADSEQDIYSLNANGHSYKLLFRPDGTIVTMPFSQVKVTADFQTSTWVVILEDGTEFTFGGGENFYEWATTSFGNLGFVSYKSSWYLKSIKSPLGDLINFAYDHNYVAYDYAVSQTDFIEYTTTNAGQVGINVGSCGNFTEGGKTTVSRQSSSSVTLHSIENEVERLEFVPDSLPRRDVEGSNTLSRIRRFSKLSNQYLDEYNFQYNYSEAVNSGRASEDDYTKYRLKLSRLSKVGSEGGSPQLWDFSYDNQRLPRRSSFAQDHWGYFNGAISNKSLLPKIFKYIPERPDLPIVITAGFMPGAHDLGADKETDPGRIKAESLTRITYPTGGITTFEYEANSLPGTAEILTDESIPIVMNLSSGLPYPNSASIPFVVTQGQYVYMELNSSITQSIVKDFPSAKITALITNDQGYPIPSIVDNGRQYFVLPSAGTYTFAVTTNVNQDMLTSPADNVHAEATLKYKSSQGEAAVNKYFGGLRIKSITDSDMVPGSPVKTRYFVYEQPYVISPITDGDYYTELFRTAVAEQGYHCDFVKMIRSSSRENSLSNKSKLFQGQEHVDDLGLNWTPLNSEITNLI